MRMNAASGWFQVTRARRRSPDRHKFGDNSSAIPRVLSVCNSISDAGDMENEQTLRRFVLRARRIAAHSLATEPDVLRGLADFTLAGSLALDGTIELRRRLPDEEIFESLAARLRPVLLGSESIYHEKVLTAIEGTLAEADTKALDISECLLETARLRERWARFTSTNLVDHRYSVGSVKVDGTEPVSQVSDSQLALAWLYGDLVHVDVKGEKKPGTLLPMKERYSAAVPYFSDVALLCADTFELILAISDLGLLDLGSEALEAPVVVGLDELTSTGLAFIAPSHGEEMPAFDIASGALPAGFKQLTVTELLRLNQRNRVQVRLEAADGNLISEHEGGVTRNRNGTTHAWRALVAGAITYELTFDVEADRLLQPRCTMTFETVSTNEMALEVARFERDASRSAVIRFIVNDREFFTIPASAATQDEARTMDISVEVLSDLVAIEAAAGVQLPLVGASATYLERANLRRMRLLWEGHVVPFVRSPLTTTVPRGVVPDVLGVPASSQNFADLQFPSPALLIRHPLMEPGSVREAEASQLPQDLVEMVIPVAEPFVAWAPDKRSVNGDSDLARPSPWGLSHFDTSSLLGDEWSPEQGITTRGSDSK